MVVGPKAQDSAGRGKQAKPGYTLVEVLVASTIMVIALTGILEMAFAALKKADAPENVQQAIKFAQERLDYFRAQRNPYQAVGGSYYQPPVSRNDPDYNLPPDGNNLNLVFNTQPGLLLREYLYGFDEHRNGEIALNVDAGSARAAQRGNIAQGMVLGTHLFAPNEIPPTPISVGGGANPPPVMGIVPNPDNVAPPMTSSLYFETGFTAPNGTAVPFSFTYAPRANDTIRANGGGFGLDPAIKFVREVWIQTSNPAFNGPMVPNGTPMLDTENVGALNALSGLNPNKPETQANLPPYVVAVTVRVYARDPRTRTIVLADPGNPTFTRLGPDERFTTSGPGYNRSRPLATMVGYYGLRRL